jgi:hypothetical protein
MDTPLPLVQWVGESENRYRASHRPVADKAEAWVNTALLNA